MTKQEKKMKKYCARVKRRLNLPRDVKKRVMNDFRSSISARQEAGETDEAIFAELGTPAEAAAVLNEQMKDYAYRKSPWRWAALAAGVWIVLAILNRFAVRMEAQWMTLVIGLSHGMSLGELVSVGVIGGADGPTSIFIATAPGPDYEVWLGLAVLAACLFGWWRLGHLKKK